RLADFVLAMKRITNIIPRDMREALTGEKASAALAALAGGDAGKAGFSTALFSEEAEKTFHAAAELTARKLADLDLPGGIAESLAILEGLVPDINSFFDDVLINCEDEEVRVNRLRFLKALNAAFGLFCDFSQISGEQ
ncbi:MAG TPA: hypothetical protein VLA34_11330, partial [Candidatus Krumholzibacterium sp.]|nr:hypothetical protein [Candidatus Krumholzibacterium sp.]